MERKKLKIKKLSEKELIEHHRKNTFKCKRCLMAFPDAEQLKQHREDMHGEYEENDHLWDARRKETNGWRSPPRKEWITNIGKFTYWYNPWRNEYYMYKLGIGIISNKFYPHGEDEERRTTEMIIADENSDYYKIWRDVITGNKKIPKETIRPKLQTLEPLDKKEAKQTGEYHICKSCNRLVRIIWQGDLQNQIICPKCGNSIFKERLPEEHVLEVICDYSLPLRL